MVANFGQKGKNEVSRKKIILQVVCLLAVILLLILIVADIKIYKDKKAMVAKIDSYEEQIKKIKDSNNHLNEEISNANNKDYLEQMAYEQFDKHRPGEQEFIFVAQNQQMTKDSQNNNFLLGWLSGFWEWMSGKKK